MNRILCNAIFLLIYVLNCNAEDKRINLSLDRKEQVVMGKENWNGTKDCAATANLVLKENGLEISVFVTDDNLVANHPSFYQNDGVEIYLDLRPYRFRGENYYSQGVLKMNLIPGFSKTHPNEIDYYPKRYPVKIPGIQVNSKTTNTGYMISVFIPQKGLKANYGMLRNNFRFDLGINDTDNRKRETQIMWHGNANNWDNPANFGEINFDE